MAAPETLDQVKDWFKSYTLSQKVGLLVSAASVIVLLWTLVYFVNQIDYQVLYSEMEPAEAQAVVQRLQGMSIEYELSDDGRTIRVPVNQLSEVRIQLASEGLPESGIIGFEIFDRTNFGLTNFQEQVNFQRALEGELARSVGTLSEVATARVHLVLSKDSLFQTRENQTKASVILTLKRGRSLPASAVSGIVHLVASSVKGLEPAKVTVIDYAGRVLSNSGTDNPASGQQMDSRMTVETDLAEKILRILEPVVGPGKVRPQVSVVMDWRQVQETIEQYDPNASVIRSEQRSSERAPGGGPKAPAAGIPGPDGGPIVAPAEEEGQTSDFVTQNEVVNYEVSKSVRTVVDPVGEIERMSVAVVIDDSIGLTVDEDGVASTVQVPRTPQEMTQYRDLVSATVGLDPARGDTLTVENVSFGMDEVLPVEPPTLLEQQLPLVLTALRYLLVPVIFLFVYMLFLRPLQKTLFANWQPGSRPQLAEAGFPSLEGGLQTPMSVQQLEAQLGSSAQLPDLPAQPGAALPNGASPERDFLPLPSSNKVDMIRSRVIEHAKREPETVARLVRVWLNDEQNK